MITAQFPPKFPLGDTVSSQVATLALWLRQAAGQFRGELPWVMEMGNYQLFVDGIHELHGDLRLMGFDVPEYPTADIDPVGFFYVQEEFFSRIAPHVSNADLPALGDAVTRHVGAN